MVRSKLLRSPGLQLLLFSCPPTSPADGCGVVFPESEAWFKARFTGLFGEVRVRDDGRAGAVLLPRVDDRSASFALGGKGTAKGEGV